MISKENATKFFKHIEKLAWKPIAIGHISTNNKKVLVIETGISYSKYQEMIDRICGDLQIETNKKAKEKSC